MGDFVVTTLLLEVKDAEALLNVASWPPSNVAGSEPGVDGWPWPRFRSVSPEVLELDLSLKTPGLQEVEKHSADIPAKFKPAAEQQKDGVFVFFCWFK